MASVTESTVAIVGAGPAGLATAVCLLQHSITSIIFEKEEYSASLWKNRTYDRLKLHLAKEFCSLPRMPFPRSTPTFVPREEFIKYIDDYVQKFRLEPLYSRCVKSATFEPSLQRWSIEAKNNKTGEVKVYKTKFLVVATGENSEGIIPKVPGLDTFPGEVIHSSHYHSGAHLRGQKTLVVGCGNSGMEIAYDLWNHGANTTIVVRNHFHILNKELVYMGMKLLKLLPLFFVDRIIVLLAKIRYMNMEKYGIHRPQEGPFYIKGTTGRSPTIDVGTADLIKKGEIKVNPGILNINGRTILFESGDEGNYDAIVFATGYRSSALSWLQDFNYIFNVNGMPKERFPNHWKGENNLYCAGFSRRGLNGISFDAEAIASDIGVTEHLIKK